MNKEKEPVVSYEPVEVEDFKKITHHLEEFRDYTSNQ